MAGDQTAEQFGCATAEGQRAKRGSVMAGFRKATKSQAKLRAAVFGPSGGGKTMSALRMARGMAGGGTVAVIDTERGSASKYSDRFDFDVLDLKDHSVQGYVEAIKSAHGYDVLVIDSLSHGWQSLLEEVEKLAKAKYRGNTWSAWSEGTPLQKKLVNAILDFPGHVLATIRSKTEWTTVEDGRGKKVPQRIGMAPEQGKGIEYEFDLLLEISTEHIANVIKDRTGRFQDKLIDKPDEEFGRQLALWLADGEPAAVSPPPPAAAPLDPRVVEIGEFPDSVKAACRAVMRAAIDSGISKSDAIDQAVTHGRELVAVEDAIEAGAPH
jgi:hypothetical protein